MTYHDQAEYEAWRRLLVMLQSSGAVTEADCSARASDLPTTPGTELFRAIRQWGAARAQQEASRRA